MIPGATRAFAARLADDDAFRLLAARDPRAALSDCGVSDEPGLVPDTVVLPGKAELAGLGLTAEQPKPTPKPPPRPPKPPRPMPIHVQLFDPS